MQHHNGRVVGRLRQPQGPVIRAATLNDADHVGRNLRPADWTEAFLLSGHDPREAVKDSFQNSTAAFVACLDERPIALFGVSDYDESRATPWLVATPEADRYGRDFVAFGRLFVQAWLDVWPCLFNYVHVDNLKSIRWLKRLGFTIHAPEPVGALGAEFHLFTQYRSSNHVH